MSRLANNSIIILLLIAVGGAGVWLGRESVHQAPVATSEPAPDESAAVASVRVLALRKGSLTETVEAYGSIQPIAGSAINISVPFESKIERVLVSPGQAVEASTPVIELGPTPDSQLQVRQSQDALAAAQRNLEASKKRREEQLATNADVATAEQALQIAQTQADNLHQRGTGETKQLTAGAAGSISAITVQPGQVVPAGTSLASVTPAHTLEALVGVDTLIADGLKPEVPTEFRDLNSNEELAPIHGTIRVVAQQVNPQTHLRDVAIRLPEGSHLLQGAFVVAQLPTATGTGWIVPRSAVSPDDDEQVVFTIVDGKAKRHVVEIALSNSEQRLITCEELHDGEPIVTTGNAELEDGMPVKIDTTAPADDDEKAKPGDEK